MTVVDLGQTVGLLLLGAAYLLHMRWWHKPKRVDLYLSPPMPRPRTPDPALPNEAGRLPDQSECSEGSP